jgi:hypothetical protein
MKADNFIEKQFAKKKQQGLGRVSPKTLIDLTTNRYKDISEVISDQYIRQEIPEHRLYMIDKVVRMRS